MLNETLANWTACLPPGVTAACPFDLKDLWLLASIVVAAMLIVSAGRSLFRTAITLYAAALLPPFSRWLSNWVKSSDYSEEEFLRADGAGERWVKTRQQALERLAVFLRRQNQRSIEWATTVRESFSDLRFTDANRVPFPFVRVMREKFDLCSVVTASQGPRLQTLDKQLTLDVSGSYGVNVAGFDRYKCWIAKGWDLVKDLGPVLGPLHPIVAENIRMLKAISKLDEVSF